MFGYCHLPFSSSYASNFNSEAVYFIIEIDHTQNVSLNVKKSLSFTLNVEEDCVIIL